MSGVMRALGLCRKAGALVCGTPMICAALPGGGLYVVYEASDTSDATHKKLSDKCKYYNTRLERLSEGGEELATAVGKTGFLAAVAVKDQNLALLSARAFEEEKT